MLARRLLQLQGGGSALRAASAPARALLPRGACAFGARPRASAFDLPDPRDAMSYRDGLGYAADAKWRPQLSKIVATIGPTSEQLPVLKDVVRSGMRIMRLNFSHATVEEVELRLANLAACKGRHSVLREADEAQQNVRGVLLDTRGPEIRTGKLAGDASGHATVQFEVGDAVTLCTSDAARDAGSTASRLYVDYPRLHACLAPGMKVLLDDGAVILTVAEVRADRGEVACTADNAGELRSRAGVNLPGAEVSDGVRTLLTAAGANESPNVAATASALAARRRTSRP